MFQRWDHVEVDNRVGIVVCYDGLSRRVWVQFSDGTRHLYDQTNLVLLEPSDC